MEVAKIGASTEYKSTKKGAVAGAVTGVITGATMYGLTKAVTLPLKQDASVASKRAFIKDLGGMYKSHGIDLSKTTVSKVIKSSKEVLKKPQVIMAGLVLATCIGAMFGAVADATKHHRTNKA